MFREVTKKNRDKMSMNSQKTGDDDVSVAFTNKVVEQLEKEIKLAETDLFDWIGSQGLEARQFFMKLMTKKTEELTLEQQLDKVGCKDLQHLLHFLRTGATKWRDAQVRTEMSWKQLKKMNGFKERWKHLSYHAKAYIHDMLSRQLSNTHAAAMTADNPTGSFTQPEREQNALKMFDKLYKASGMDDSRYIEHAAEDLSVTRMEETNMKDEFVTRVKKIVRKYELMEEGKIANAIREKQAQMDEGDPEAEEAARMMEKEALEKNMQDYAIPTAGSSRDNHNNGERGDSGTAGPGFVFPRTRSRSPPPRATERNDGGVGYDLTPPYRPMYR